MNIQKKREKKKQAIFLKLFTRANMFGFNEMMEKKNSMQYKRPTQCPMAKEKYNVDTNLKTEMFE